MFDLESLARRVAEIVLDGLRTAEPAGWIPQERSPLGRRRHINLARKEGQQLGRRYFLSQESIDRALAELTAKSRAKQAPRAAELDDAMGVRPAGGR
jgi:hypothetical protein